MKYLSKAVFGILLIFGLYSCGPEIVFSETISIENESWTYDNTIKYSFSPTDSTSIYNLLLEIEHSKDFEYQNTYVIIKTVFPNGQKEEQSLSLNLADKTGRWQGQCKGEYCKAMIGLQLNTYFKYLGEYQIEVVQDSRDNPLLGIKSFTLQLEKAEKSE